MKHTVLTLFMALGLSFPSISQAEDTTQLKTSLQASLQRNLERTSIDGAIMHLDLTSGEMLPYYPVEAHPMIIKMGEHYVMCSDLRNPDGEAETVDYYMTKNGPHYTVVRTEIGNRAPLKALMKSGAAKRLN